MVRWRYCNCKRDVRGEGHLPDRPCRYGRCVEFYCPDCRKMVSGWGPMGGCKCEGGYIRELVYPDMRGIQVHAAVKPSILKRRNRKKKQARDRVW